MVNTAHDQLSGGLNTLFLSSDTQQITAIFYGTQFAPCTSGGALGSTGGYMDLYWDDTSGASGTAGTMVNIADTTTNTSGLRTAQDQYPDFTDGIFLVRLAFASGRDASSAVTITGTALPPANGVGSGYFEVDTSTPGLWTNALNYDWFYPTFPTLPGTPAYTTTPSARDLRFDSRYTNFAGWDDPAKPAACSQNPIPANTPCILGAKGDDPIQSLCGGARAYFAGPFWRRLDWFSFPVTPQTGLSQAELSKSKTVHRYQTAPGRGRFVVIVPFLSMSNKDRNISCFLQFTQDSDGPFIFNVNPATGVAVEENGRGAPGGGFPAPFHLE